MSWYIWATLGVFAIVFEIASPTFFALFVGIGFLCSSIISYFLPDELTLQLLTAIFGMFIGLWAFKRRKNGASPICKIGQTDEFVGVKGKVVKANGDEQAVAVFSEPVFGRKEWIVIPLSDEALKQNEHIEVITVLSNHLIVKKISN